MNRINEDGELEKRCSKCGEWWPADKEFFSSLGPHGGLNSWCKACYQEYRNAKYRADKMKEV